MTVLRHALRLSAVAGLAAVPMLALAPTAFATRESSNRLDFDAVNNSAADGAGTINYVKGASDGTEENSVWQQSLCFTGLEPGAYSVMIKKGDGDGDEVPGSRDREICEFTATDSGTGTCTGRFLELRALAVAQLKNDLGEVVAQATRTGAPTPSGGKFTTAAPGEITSKGGCREPSRPARSAPPPVVADRGDRPLGELPAARAVFDTLRQTTNGSTGISPR